jgi:hypothetical protein
MDCGAEQAKQKNGLIWLERNARVSKNQGSMPADVVAKGARAFVAVD